MGQDFEGKVALVTGGGSGIGRATCVELASRGASVVIADLNEAGAAETAAGLASASAVKCDVSDPADLDRAVAEAVERFGGLDILVSNAGMPLVGPIADITPEALTRLFQVNVGGVAYGIRAAAPAIAERGGGAIVSTASAAGTAGGPGMGLYGASKAAVINLTETAALELRPMKIRVNCVCPGIVETPMLDHIRAEYEKLSPMSIDDLVMMKQERFAEPEDLARGIAYLASDAAEFVSGQALVVDNGLTASLF